ncbi:hypothetical protein BDZ89DRAFT_569725 [Hymenopellis radicata]|nr:hypothetical protein BDZ89DRAFT_569725 [Hymenopellis radicata]
MCVGGRGRRTRRYVREGGAVTWMKVVSTLTRKRRNGEMEYHSDVLDFYSTALYTITILGIPVTWMHAAVVCGG